MSTACLSDAVGRAIAGDWDVIEFSGTLWKYPGKGGWTFVDVPEDCAPPVTEQWGRTPVIARWEGVTWETSVWRDKSGRTLLPIPKKVHRGKIGEGDTIVVGIGPRD